MVIFLLLGDNFEIPVNVTVSGKSKRLDPTNSWQKLNKNTDLKSIKVDTGNFYVTVKK